MSIFKTPLYITGAESDANKEYFDYILYKPEFEILLNEMSEQLKHPTTIIEFKNENEYEKERTDSTRSRILFSYCCEIFRITDGSNLCTKCDRDYAYLFNNVNITDGQLKNVIDDRINTEQYFITSYDNSHACKPQFVEHQDSQCGGYLLYNCPMMGLRELIFPIMVERRILGVLFVGQIQVDTPEEKGKILEIRKQFLDTHEDVFSTYLEKYPEIKISKIKRELMRLDDPRQNKNMFDLMPDAKMPGGYIDLYKSETLPQNEYDAFVPKIFAEIELMESELSKKLAEKRKLYVESVFNEVLSENYKQIQRKLPKEDINKEDTNTEEYTKEYWDAIKGNLRNILSKLGLQYISIYAAKLPKTSNNKIEALNLVACVADNNEDEEDNLENYHSFDLKYFENIDDAGSNIHVFTTLDLDSSDTQVNENLYNCVKIIDHDNRDIFFCPVRIDMDCSVAIVIGYQKSNTLEALPTIKKLIGNGVLKLITQILPIPAFLQNVISKQNTERTFRIYRHEITQLTLSLRLINNRYLKKPKRKILYVSNKKLEDIYNDNRSSLERLNNLSQNIKILVSPFAKDKLRKEEFQIFKELLYKWKMIYKRDAHAKNIEFILPDLYLRDEQRPLINSNKEELEHLVFNLVSNAMKYSYWGTRIHIDCKALLHNPGRQCLSITDYGHEIEEGNAPYKLYYRNKQLIKNTTEGNGIGLYVAQEVAKSLDISLTHRRERVSRFNIPLMHHYIDTVDSKTDLYRKVENTYMELYESGVLEPILSKRSVFGLLTSEQILTEIDWPTYKVTFEAVI